MSPALEPRPHVEHDWHSPGYVDEWIARDAARNDERRPRLREMLAAAPFTREAPVTVIDVGGGYGVVTEEVLRLFPRARVTLQDYSRPMLDAARGRLAPYRERVRYATGDLCDPSWTEAVGGPFDLAVSAIAVHNLRDPVLIAQCYAGIVRLLKPGAMFLDYDLFDLIGGVAAQRETLRAAGFAQVDCLWQESPRAILAATAPAAR
jgi:2-polyprenyl-3-methyl-5-hydroxy-6-metoxy-1,4-benzoquinol methylase